MPIETKKFTTRVFADDVMMAETDSFDIWHKTLTMVHQQQERMAREAAREQVKKAVLDDDDDPDNDD